MNTNVYRSGSIVTTIPVDDGAKCKRTIAGVDEISMEVVQSSETLTINVGDYIIFDNRNYYLNRPVEFEKRSAVEYQFSLVFEADSYTLLNKLFQQPVTGRGDFSLVDSIEGFIDVLLANINSIESGWTKGIIPASERKTITFDGNNCREVLNMLADNYDMEFVVIGKQINFHNIFETATSLTFEYGKGKGLYQLNRDNVDSDNTVTRGWFWGASKNINYSYRDGETRLMFTNPATGTNRIDNFGDFNKIVEKQVVFEDIFPHFTGSINSVVNNVTAGLHTFTCPEIDFDLTLQLIEGLAAKVFFKSGDLQSQEFEISSYDHPTRTVKLITYTDEFGQVWPNTSFYPKAGDQFTFLDINMPSSYVVAAEAELATKAAEWMDYYSKLRVKYSLELDPRYLRNNSITLNLGDVVRIIDTGLSIDKQIRITTIEKSIANPFKINCEISNIVEERWEKQISKKVQEALNNSKIATEKVSSTTMAIGSFFGKYFEIRGTAGNEYICAKFSFASVGEITAYTSVGAVLPTFWDSLPTASATIKGGIIIGTGLTIVDGIVSVDASAIGGNQTLSFAGSTLSISNGNSVDLSSLAPTWGNISGKPSAFTPSAHDHSFDSLTGKKTTLEGYGITNAVDTYSGVCGTIIDSTTFATSFCQDIFGTEAVGFFLREIRTNANAPASLLNDYASGLAWKGGDTFGSLMVSFKNPNIRVSGGAQKDAVWVADLWHDKNFNPANKADLNGSSSVNFYASALTASSVTVSGLNASTVLISDTAKGIISSSVTSDKLIALAQMFDLTQTSGGTQYIRANFSLASVGELTAYSAGVSFDNVWNQMPFATTTNKGGIIIGTGLTIVDGVVSVDGSYGNQTLSFVNNILSLTGGGEVNLSSLTPTWDSISGKPATFTASAHRHSYSDLDNVPATFAPSTHSHSYSSLTDKPTSFTPSSHSHTYASILDKPATFTPSAHDHSFASLTSKPTTLPGYGVTDGVLGVELADSTTFATSFCQDIFGTTSPGYFLREIRTRATAPSSLLGGYASGLAWKGADTYGSLMVAFASSQIRVSGGAGNNPAWTVDLWHTNNFDPTTKAALNGNIAVAFNTATLNVNGDFQINGKTAIRQQDGWLFINDPKNFTSGIFCGAGVLRTDGIFQVGDSGVNFMIEGRTTTIGGLVKLKHIANEVYNKIDFCNDSLVSHAAIHAFSTAWASGSVALSSGCINLDGTNGVTIGNWNNPALLVDSANHRIGINRVATSFALEVQGRLAVGDYTNGTALIASHGGNAYFGCNIAENGVVVYNTGDVSTGNGAVYLRKEGGIEIYHASTPYIDFHYASNAGDYTTRLIEISAGNLQLIGNFVATGEVTAWSSSDANLKTAVQDIHGRALSTLKRLRPVEFEWNDIAKKLNPEFARYTHSASFIAQEYETVFEWATHTIWGKYKSIDKNILFPYLVAGVNELDFKIDTVEDRLNKRIEELERQVRQLEMRLTN